MNRAEDVLREALDRRAATPPQLPDLMSAIERRRQAQRQRRIITASAAAVVLLVASVSIIALTLTGRHKNTAAPPNRPTAAPSSRSATPRASHGDGVPFAPIPAGSAMLDTNWPMTGPPTPICTSANLRLHVLDRRTTDSATSMRLVARSIGRHSCRLDRNIIGLGIAAAPHGSLLQVGAAGGIQPKWAPNFEPRIDPGVSVLLNASWSNWCGSAVHAGVPALRPTETITIPADNTVPAPPCNSPKSDSVAEYGSRPSPRLGRR